jgi:inorganic pyrophosphatase
MCQTELPGRNSHLKPFDRSDKSLLQVVIETPKGSRNEFAFNADEHVFELKKVLPAGMSFPYDFGFVPSTEADDGDQRCVTIGRSPGESMVLSGMIPVNFVPCSFD